MCVVVSLVSVMGLMAAGLMAHVVVYLVVSGWNYWR